MLSAAALASAMLAACSLGDGEWNDNLGIQSSALVATCNGLAATTGCTVAGVPNQLCVGSDVVGTAGADVIVGTSGDDVLLGKQGRDTICGLAGNDELQGNREVDYLDGGEGDDFIVGGKNAMDQEYLFGGPGNDILDGRTPFFGDNTSGANVLDGGDGLDICYNADTSSNCQTPAIIAVSPDQGPTTGGTDITITGTHFDHMNGVTVTIGGVAATVTSITQSEITVELPGSLGNVGPADVVVTDLYGLDHVAASSFTYYYGDVSFSSPVQLSSWDDPRGLVLDDFNGDAHPDTAVITRSPTQQISVRMGNGDGTFGSAADYAVTQTAITLGATDLDGDAFLDLVAPTGGGSAPVNVFLNRQDGTFDPAALYNAGSQARGNLVFGDMNEDGNVDLVMAGRNGVEIKFSNSDGTLGGGKLYNVTQTIGGVGVGDLNNDSHLDVVATEPANSLLLVYLGNGDGTLQAAIPYDLSSLGTAHFVLVADFNGDSELDVAADMDSFVQLLFGDGTGSLALSTTTVTMLDTDQRELDAVDIDGNGALDLLIANGTDNSVSVMLGAGDGTFPSSVTLTNTERPRYVRAADLDSDGRLDLVVANDAASSDYLSVFMSIAQ